MTKTMTMEEWKYQKYHGYTETKPDGTRYLLYMDNGATVWGPVEIVESQDGEAARGA